ncbi:CinA family nicotinamide mononucleotide deamidase-related protein [Dasania sp. GY-MA-18]|uniref:CinA-like protein n=1 Tax=Dasania phycosphaerae TaxID=2950436 RepID=A0A9J6RKV0_9GAMM|nr:MULTISPECIES: CinA family nicotinamide mononucleotide deamidase-related protein [Dasania]MCR8922903.1 CinA family nicotinamide mononucleotide deamidase-related protein [Dasania sp. GY-MA-18]MCZ0865334.1 CinA family nicotinamide mononucleotide deamidase-related protein [Dasania phycosphaerae]MCZ0869059.1 CinA family nicotinamide mononucleotide deamidase-related protein [Dasania phycosphaerae]
MRIQLLLTGNEIMSGHTVDSNSAMIAEQLHSKAYEVYRKVTIGDDFDLLVEEIRHISTHSEVLIINGGLGPTVDDLTAQALATASGQAIVIHEAALKHVTDWYDRRKIRFSDSAKKQALLPEHCQLIDNPTGSAVGFYCDYQGCLIICTPGVPSELRRMMNESVLDLISQRFPNQLTPSTLRLQTFGLGESFVQELVNKNYPHWPKEVELGFRAGMPQLELKLAIQQAEHQKLQQQCYQWLQQEVGDSIIGADNCSLAEAVLTTLKQQQQTLCCAESCTGGLIAAMLTEVPGSSAAFEGGVVSYSNHCKQQLLDVDSQLLQQHGAVSEPVVRAMAEGALVKTGADYAIAISGIAGPDGGSDDKPVGTVYIGWGKHNAISVIKLCYPQPRTAFQKMMAAVALDMLRRELLGLNLTPSFIKRYIVE